MVKLYVSLTKQTMTFVLQPRQLLLLILPGWVNRYQQQVIDFYISQTMALLESQGKKKILLDDEQRRLLAVKGIDGTDHNRHS